MASAISASQRQLAVQISETLTPTPEPLAPFLRDLCVLGGQLFLNENGCRRVVVVHNWLFRLMDKKTTALR